MVLKFEGSSMEDLKALSHIKNVVAAKNNSCVVVASALNGVLHLLNKIFETATDKGRGFEEELHELEQRHVRLARQLISKEKLAAYLDEVKLHLDQLYNVLNGVGVLRQSVISSRDYVLAKGSILSSLLLVKVLDEASWHDSREFIVTNDNFGFAEIIWDDTCRAMRREFKDFEGIAVVPGFCGKTKSGYTTTLGPVGVNLSVAIMAAAFHNREVA